MLAALLSQAWVGDAGGGRRKRRYIHDGIVSTSPAALQAMVDALEPEQPVNRGRPKRAKAAIPAPIVSHETPAAPPPPNAYIAGLEAFEDRASNDAAFRRAETKRILAAIQAVAERRRVEAEDEDDIETLIMMGLL